MAVEIPQEAIHQLQIALRKQAQMSSYDPDDTPLPNLPSPEETISDLDPSPPYLRCKHCKGRLLRGVASLSCVFCGDETCKELPPDPINFRNTLGFRWLLKSLDLTGSEIVDQSTEAYESSRGQAAAKEEVTLSELLSVEIRWSSKFVGTGIPDEKTPTWPKRFLGLAGVDLGSFSEGEKDAALSASEEPFEPNTRIATTESSSVQHSENISMSTSEESFDPTKPTATAENDAFKGNENLGFFAFEPGKQTAFAESSAFNGSENLSLFASEKSFESSKQINTTERTAFQGNDTVSLFENAQPSETAVKFTQGESGHSYSSWPASFQSAASENLPQDSKSLDPAEDAAFQGNETLSLFQDAQPSETAVKSTQGENGHSISGWPASFQPAASENLPQESKSLDSFAGSTVDLSTHIDTLFGSVGDSTKVKSNHSTSTSNDWFSDDLLSTSNLGSAGQPQPLESLATAKTDIKAENEYNLHSSGIDWAEDTQWQTTSKDAPDNKIADQDDDSFGAWNDFTSLSSTHNPPSSSKQTAEQTTPADKTSMTDLFSTASDSQADDSFGAWNDFTSLSSAHNRPSSSKQTAEQTTPADKTSMTDLFSTASDSQADESFGAWNDFTSSSSTQNPSSSSKQAVDQTTPADKTAMTDLFSTAGNSQVDDPFGAWNDFTSFSSARTPSSSSKQNVDQMRPAEETSVTNQFNTATDSHDWDFGSYLQPDLSARESSSSHDFRVANITQPEASAFDRMVDLDIKDEDVAKNEGDVFSAKAESKSDDVEKIMSQMHDLSFMLESNLSIPPKADVHSLSQDRHEL